MGDSTVAAGGPDMNMTFLWVDMTRVKLRLLVMRCCGQRIVALGITVG